MNNKKIYICLYYFALLLSIFICTIPSILQTNFINADSSLEMYVNLSGLSFFLISLNLILIIIFTILLIKRSLSNTNILFPTFYILFAIVVLIICVLFNNRLVIPYIQYSYYINFILMNYTLLNLYSALSINKHSKKKIVNK